MGGDRHEKGKIRSREEGVSPSDRRVDRDKWRAWPGELDQDTQDIRNSGTQPSKMSMLESTLAARKEFDTVEPKLVCTNQALCKCLSEKTTGPVRLSGVRMELAKAPRVGQLL